MSQFHVEDVFSPSDMKSAEVNWCSIKTLHLTSATDAARNSLPAKFMTITDMHMRR